MQVVNRLFGRNVDKLFMMDSSDVFYAREGLDSQLRKLDLTGVARECNCDCMVFS